MENLFIGRLTGGINMSTFNSIWTKLCGERNLTVQEYEDHKDQLPYDFNDVQYKIATNAIVVLYLPVLPVETLIYIDTDKSKWGSKQYIVFGTYHVNWDHVKHSISFYVVPILILIYFLSCII